MNLGLLTRATALIVLLAGLVFAQTTNARLEGTVQDQTGAVIPNAKLALVNIRTQARAEDVTDGNGNFVFPTLAPGMYSMTVEAGGFSQTIGTQTSAGSARTLQLAPRYDF